MAIVCVDLESTLPSWHTTAVYSAATTYAQNDYVIADASDWLSSGTTAVLWKSLQNGNTGNALVEGAWWTVVADGSAAKPYKSIWDATSFDMFDIASGNEIRIKKTPDPVALNNSYTFYETGTYKGKAVVAGNNPDSLAVDDVIGSWDIGWWLIYSITYSAPNTIIQFSGTTEAEHWFASPNGTDETPTTTYKLPTINSGNQTVNSSGSDEANIMWISCGWNFSNPNYPVRDGYTALLSSYIDSSDRDYVKLTYAVGVKSQLFRAIDSTFIWINNCAGVNCAVSSYGYGPLMLSNCMVTASTLVESSASLGQLVGTIKDCTCLRSYILKKIENPRFYVKNVNVRRARFGFSVNLYKGNLICENCQFYDFAYNSVIYTASPSNEQRWVFKNCSLSANVALSGGDDYYANQLGVFYYHNFNNVVNDHRIITRYGKILSDATTRHTASGIAWRFEPGSLASEVYPDELSNEFGQDLFEVAVSANTQVTATIWCKKSDADSAFEAQFICKGGQLAGITNDVTAVASDSTDWQQLTIQVTPTETGVLRFGFQVWGSETATCHIDDFGVSQ